MNLFQKSNKLIAINIIDKFQMVNLVSLSIDINDLKDNLKWESPKKLN